MLHQSDEEYQMDGIQLPSEHVSHEAIINRDEMAHQHGYIHSSIRGLGMHERIGQAHIRCRVKLKIENPQCRLQA